MQEVALAQESALTLDDLQEIVERASTITERLTDEFQPDERNTRDAVIAARLDEWRQTVAQGNEALFRQRLAWDGLDLDTVRPVLGHVRRREEAPLPAWSNWLQDAVTCAAAEAENGVEPSKTETYRFLRADQRLPFEEILLPFVLLARQRLAGEAGKAYDLLTNDAHAMLERSLLQVLTRFAGETLYLEFSIMRAQEQSPVSRIFALAQDGEERTVYEQFVQQMRHGKLVAFLREYAVLARYLATITARWVEANAEFLQRLAVDWDEIERVFGGDEGELGQVSAIQSSLSDPHNGRRSVMILTFATGRKLVYKPKDLGTEEAYTHLLAWLTERGAPLPFKPLTILNHSSHGWVEFVEYIPCGNAEEVRRYYRRAGMLLCLGYALEGTDWHYENLIASGEHPVVVDMESLLQHRALPFNEEDGADARMLAIEQLGNSVLRIGLLPDWRVSKDGQIAYDPSGLGGVEVQDVPYKIAKWENINTDRMTLEFMTGQFRGRTNAPMTAEAPINLADHADEIITGFEQMYQFLIEERDALLAPNSPLHELGRQEVRFIVRATKVYGLILKQLLSPTYLRDGADQSIQIELLARAFLPPSAQEETNSDPSILWLVFAAERQAMEQTDIPFFTARPDSDSLVVAGEVIEACFEEPSFDLAVRRLRSFGPEDVERQVGMIRAVFYSRVARDTDIASVATVLGAASEVSADEPLTSEALVGEAVTIAEQIRSRAIAAEDGSAAWIAPVYMVQAERYQLNLAGYDLYNGVTGIALFLAAVDKVTASTAHRDLALGAVQPLRLGLQRHGKRMAAQLGIGGASGLGSVVYGLVGLSRFLDEPVLLADARRAALLITAERIANDVALDIISGAAGATLGLLVLHRAVPDQEILHRAIACGEHLLNARTMTEGGHRAWPTIRGKYITGFSHGAAGIAYALLRLYEATQNRAFLDAAREGIAYEDSLFSPHAGNWPDLRHDEQPAFMSAWCHGAPGIGLARLGGLPVLDGADVRADIEAALQTTQQHGAQDADLLCCGSLGRLEFLLAAAERLPRPELAETARLQVAKVLSRARQRGSFYIHSLLPDGVYSPGFFRGTAGIGYELLRLAHPAQLPSVLLWE